MNALEIKGEFIYKHPNSNTFTFYFEDIIMAMRIRNWSLSCITLCFGLGYAFEYPKASNMSSREHK